MAKDLLLEIGTEEIPAKFMPAILTQLKEKAEASFAESRIAYQSLEVYGTPRRLVLACRGVEEQQQDLHKEVKGPAKKAAYDETGNWSKAAQGFARSQGTTVQDLVIKPFEGGEYVFAIITGKGRETKEIIAELLTVIITNLSFPKSMRWANYDFRFVRPIRWLLALFGQKLIDLAITDVVAGNVTYGHRFLSHGPLAVNSLEDYLCTLTANYVIVDPAKREELIRDQIAVIAKQQGGTASIDEALLEEVVYLIEYPTALYGQFEETYLQLPDPVLITPMREHQRYFPVYGLDGKLLNGFITVRNGTADHISTVRAGNEKVLRARLADAQFFWDQDRESPLSDRVEDLKSIVFQEGLGTMWDKTERIKKLTSILALATDASEQETASALRAATLAKADLMTAMVKEFTELQGIMGREYARLSGEEAAVTEAIFEHYLPRFAGDILPESTAGKLVGIADKLDTIVGTFSRGLIPTGSQDPYALRRQALGIVNILIDSEFNVSLAKLLQSAICLLNVKEAKQEKLLGSLQEFFQLRLRNILADQGVRYDIVDAVFAEGIDDIYATYKRAHALAQFAGRTDFVSSLTAYTRVLNLAKKAGEVVIDTALFQDSAERTLYNVYQVACQHANSAVVIQDYEAALIVLKTLQGPIDAFFAAVMVMVEDEKIKNNRLALLKGIAELMRGIADMSKVVV